MSSYLKSLGILRLLAEQKDPGARGWWQDEHFCLLTELDREELERFFLEEYAPTPFVSPWNKGSGFVAKDDAALDPLERSTASRFVAFRVGIAAARANLGDLTEADAAVRRLKDRTKVRRGVTDKQNQEARQLKDDADFKAELAEAERRFKTLKADLFRPLLKDWRGAHRRWLDGALVWLEDEGKPAWPALLGTGGNDGRLDFTNNAMKRIGELFDLGASDGGPRSESGGLLSQCLWGVLSNDLAAGAAVGQFNPGSAGGANSTNGAIGDSLINSWEFVLALEGAILFGARSTRRLDPAAIGGASAPFAVRGQPVGYGSRGQDKTDRGEQWMPLWTRPATGPDLEVLLSEGRMQLGRQVAHRPLDVARAVSRLGTARGIASFVRYGYLERNGQARIAVPLGRIDVLTRPRVRLLDDLAPWLERLERRTRDQQAIHRLAAAVGRLSDSVFALLTHDDSPDRWQAVLLAASAVEQVQASGTGFEAGPIPPLSADWLQAAKDGSPEWRLACALGSACAFRARDRRAVNPVRHHALPLDSGGHRFKVFEMRLARDPRCVMLGRDPVGDCLALVERRLTEAAAGAARTLPLVSAPGCAAWPSDLADLIAGRVDLARVLDLARALMAVRWDRWTGPGGNRCGSDVRWPAEAWMALRLASLPWPLDEARRVPTDPAMVRRLVAGDAAAAVALALRHLRGAGFRAPLSGACADPATARLWGAALAFPIDRRVAQTMSQRFGFSQREEIR
ncbi:MAG: type I-U CRISPR-associated protein Csx17 [Candidatus Wallbacteria bacterium]|nr:type I-U CRISPR-associated protein Csx17 [Candidatus Wallbacteria bacterium]